MFAPEALSGRHERAGGDHDVVLHNDLVHDDGAHPNQHTIAHGASVQ